MGNANLALHAAKWLGLGEVSCVKLLQGDSRQFARIVGEAVGVRSTTELTEGEFMAFEEAAWDYVAQLWKQQRGAA
jgi:hypothetical protein